MNTNHTSQVLARRNPVAMPPIHSAIYVSSENVDLNLNGNMEIDGNDHNMDGTPGPELALPGIGVDDPSDSAFVVNSLKPKIANDILGQGGSPSVKTIADSSDW